MLLRRISLIRNRGVRAEVRGLFVTYGGVVLILLVCVVSALPVVGYFHGRAGRQVARAERLLETQRLMYLSLRERHNSLLEKLSNPQNNASSPRRAGADEEANPVGGYMRSYAADEFQMGNFEECLSVCRKLLGDRELPREARREAHLRQTFSLVYLGRFDEALAAATAAEGEFAGDCAFLQAKADILLKRGLFGRAAPLIERIFRENPGPAALFSRGNLAWGLGRHEEAVEDFREVLCCGVSLLEKAAANNLALLYAESLSDRENALFYLSMLQRLAPVGFRTDRTAGRVLLLAGDYGQAEGHLLKCYSRNPRDAEVLLDLALLYEKTGREALSQEYLREAIAVEPGCAEASGRLRGAWIFALAGRTATNDRRARETAGETARGYLETAHAAIRSGRGLEARAALEKALEAAPNDANVLLFAAAYCNAAGNGAAAEGFCLRVLDLDPRNLGAIRSLAAARLAGGDYPGAGQWAARGLEADDRDTLLLGIAATSHFARRQWDPALAFARRYLAAGGAETSHIHYILATCRKAAGAQARVVAGHYEKAIELDGANVPAINDYIAYLAREGRADKGVALVERLLALSGRAAFALDTAGFVHYRAGDPGKAVVLLEEALRKDSAHPEILLHGALVYRKLGQTQKSARLFEEAVLRAGEDAELVRYMRDEYENG